MVGRRDRCSRKKEKTTQAKRKRCRDTGSMAQVQHCWLNEHRKHSLPKVRLDTWESFNKGLSLRP
jgi:hypothetical protein